MWNRKPLKEVAYTAGRIGWKGLTAKEYVAEGPYFLSVHSLNYGDFVDFRDAFNITQARYDESPEIAVEANDILICKDGAGIGKVGIVKDVEAPTTINSSLLLIRSLSEIYPKFLYHYLQSPFFQKIVQERIEGATTPHLYQREIKEFPVPIPELSEQQRIVAILDKAFADIEKARANAEKNLKNARELFDSYLQQVFSQRGEGFIISKLSDLCLKITDGSHNPPKGLDISNYLMLSSKNVFNDFIHTEKPRYLTESDFKSENKRTEVKCGDVLLTIVGTIGRAAVVDDSLPAFTLQRSVAVLKPNRTKVLSRFLMYSLHSLLTQLFDEARGVAQKGLYLKTLRGIEILVPPICEQQHIVASLDILSDEVKQLEKCYQEKLVSLDELKKSLLQKAFSGELTQTEGHAA